MMNTMVKRYWPNWNGEIQEGNSGWNNTTRYLEIGGKRLILRIYETHRDRDKIAFEHEVLEKLAVMPLSFATPLPVHTPGEGETILPLADGSGRYGCLFTYIEGICPEKGAFQGAYAFGRAAAELLSALALVTPDLPHVYRPYYELQQSYPACSYERVMAFCEDPPEVFHDLGVSLVLLKNTFKEVYGELEGFSKLPQQLIHGDLNPSNLLVKEGQPSEIAALLDFEFCTRDVRAMEPAVILADLLGYAGKKELIPQFIEGFGAVLKFSPEETAAIPVLMELRKVDVFLHFMSRYLNGTDTCMVLREQIPALAAGLLALEQDNSWICGLLEAKLQDTKA